MRNVNNETINIHITSIHIFDIDMEENGKHMKILQINGLGRTRSTGRNVYEMHSEFIKIGIESYVAVSAEGMSEEDYGQYIIGNKADMKLHALFSRIFGLQGYFSVKPTKELIKYILEINPDAVILHVLHGNYINVNMLLDFLKTNHIITLIVLHDLWFLTGHCVYPTTTNCEKYKNKCINCDQLKEGNISYFFDTSNKIWKDRRKAFRNWGELAIVGVSNWVTNCAMNAAVLKDVRHFYRIYNWIDTTKFCKRAIKEDNNFIILGVSVEWSKVKGIEDFVKLSKMLKNEKLILVGHMDEQYKKEFDEEKVEIIEFTNSEEELCYLYNQANVYLSLSKQETFGKTIAEAICCGTPVIVYDKTASPELAKQGCGYVVKDGNINEVYNRIQDVKKNGKDYYLNSCLNKAKEDFSLKKNISKYISVILNLQRNKGDNDCF